MDVRNSIQNLRISQLLASSMWNAMPVTARAVSFGSVEDVKKFISQGGGDINEINQNTGKAQYQSEFCRMPYWLIYIYYLWTI